MDINDDGKEISTQTDMYVCELFDCTKVGCYSKRRNVF